MGVNVKIVTFKNDVGDEMSNDSPQSLQRIKV